MNYQSLSRFGRGCLVAAGIAASLVSTAGAQTASSGVALPSGTVVPVRLDHALSSGTARVGDRFTATVRYGSDDAGLPEGTRVEGVVREAVPRSSGKPGVLDLDFQRMVTPGGQVSTLTGSLIALDAKSVKRSESGRMVATSSKSEERLKFIGIGGGAGLLAAVLTKGNKLTYTVIGAAAGYLYNEFGNKPKTHDVDLKPGTEFGVRLDRALAFGTIAPTWLPAQTGTYPTAPQGDQGMVMSYSSSLGSQAQASPEDIGVMVGDQNVVFVSAKPFLRDGVSFVPLEPVALAAGFPYIYAADQRMIWARNGALRVGIGSRVAVLDGERRLLNAAPEVRDGALYVPMQFIGLMTGGSVSWDSSSRTLLLAGVAGPSDGSTGSLSTDGVR